MSEMLVGFVVFSLLLAVYLPGLYQMMARIEMSRKYTQRWATFHQLVAIQMAHMEDSIDFHLYSDSVESFECQIDHCWIRFEDGEYFETKLES